MGSKFRLKRQVLSWTPLTPDLCSLMNMGVTGPSVQPHGRTHWEH